MECAKCGCGIAEGDEATYMDETLCLDCYTDALSPLKPCDPWAVHTAKSMSQDGYILTKRQKDVLETLKKENGLEVESLASRVGLKVSELQREIATLRHMEKIRAAKQDDKKVICLW